MRMKYSEKSACAKEEFRMSRFMVYCITIVFGIGVVVMLFMPMDSFAQADWERVSVLPTERDGFVTAVVDNKIYLIGGSLYADVDPQKGDRGPFGITVLEVYDPQTNSWQRLADMPTRRTDAQAAVVDGIIYVFGGFSGKDNRFVNTEFPVFVDAYDPETDTWIRKQDMPDSRVNFNLGVVAGKVYLIGGRKDFREDRMGRVDVYDPVSDTWMEGAEMPTRRSLFGVGVVKDHIYAIGGRGWPRDFFMGGPFLTTVEEYDPIANEWRKKKDMLDLKHDFSTVVVRDDIYVIGGFVWEDGLPVHLATVAVYTPKTDAWSDSEKMPVPLMTFGAAPVDGKIYVFGGLGEGWEYFPGVLVYDTGFRAVTAFDKLGTRWGELKAERKLKPLGEDNRLEVPQF